MCVLTAVLSTGLRQSVNALSLGFDWYSALDSSVAKGLMKKNASLETPYIQCLAGNSETMHATRRGAEAYDYLSCNEVSQDLLFEST